MSKNVLVISTSIRPNSNSEMLANAFADGARTSGNDVEVVSLKDKTIKKYNGIEFNITGLFKESVVLSVA